MWQTILTIIYLVWLFLVLLLLWRIWVSGTSRVLQLQQTLIEATLKSVEAAAVAAEAARLLAKEKAEAQATLDRGT